MAADDTGTVLAVYDVVVIGAGSAGSVIAARASENSQLTVALLEAGPDYPLLHETPYDLVNSHDNSYTAHDWGYSYTPTAGGRPSNFPRGRVMGGSSAVNTTIALRGMPEDYDGWAALGNDGWSWDDVLPAFRRLERDLDFGDKPYHGDSGPITIRRYRDDELTPPQAAWLEAAAVLGYPYCDDANDPTSWGAGMHPMNKVGRVRVSTAIGYLAPARVRPNLTVRGNAPVRRLVVAGGQVIAAELEDGSRVEGRLFVVCAGAIASPGLLERSGIGRPEVLEPLAIDVVADVAGVGEGLQDHPAAAVLCEVRDGVELDLDSPIVQTILRYTSPGSEFRNDLQIEVFSFARRRGEDASPRAFAIAAVLEQCFSRGSVHITSADPASSPAIEPNMCSDERDVERLAAAFLDTIAFTEAKPMADIIENVAFPRLPVDLDSARELVRRFSGSGYHPCSSLRMGPSSDPLAVVDSRCRAYAVERLVVADASIMPTVPRANTNLTAIMVGEMVGEWIRRSPEAYGL
ncbi:MAG TPA: GMC family oxidoreductase N-terminal domain-containing protein [Acidimicrobiales bacterium]|jgi:choline dehydrogenase|nr:GMC family oxidoreductase N-terminal domain-containing protein [Acidimicrobiales bacterium]